MGSLSTEVRTEALCSYICELEEERDQLRTKNKKLQKLLASYWKAVHSPATPNVPRNWLAEMRELGVEVPE